MSPAASTPIVIVVLVVLTATTRAKSESELSTPLHFEATSAAEAETSVEISLTPQTENGKGDRRNNEHEDAMSGSDIPATTDKPAAELEDELQPADGAVESSEPQEAITTTKPQDDNLTTLINPNVVQSAHNITLLQFEDVNIGDNVTASNPTVDNEVNDDFVDLGLIRATTPRQDANVFASEADIEGSGADEDAATPTAGHEGNTAITTHAAISRPPSTTAPLVTGCTAALCQDIAQANITAEPSLAKVAEGSPVKFTCTQMSDFNQTGRHFILRWQGPNGTLGGLQENPDGVSGRAQVLSGHAARDVSETNYTCVPDVPASCCDGIGVTVTLVVYDVPVYTTHMAILGGLVLLLALVCLVLHETRRRAYRRVKTSDQVDEEWEYVQ